MKLLSVFWLLSPLSGFPDAVKIALDRDCEKRCGSKNSRDHCIFNWDLRIGKLPLCVPTPEDVQKKHGTECAQNAVEQ